MEVYERIKARRKELELSADDVAEALGVSRATVYRYESADIEKLPTQIIAPLSRVLRCSPAWLMGWDEEVPPIKEEDPHIVQLDPLDMEVAAAFHSLPVGEKNFILRALGLSEIVEKGESVTASSERETG